MRSINEPPPWGVAHCLSKQRRSQCLDKEKHQQQGTICLYFQKGNIAFKQTNNLPQGKYNAMPVKSIAALLGNISKHLLMVLYNTEPTRRILIAFC